MDFSRKTPLRAGDVIILCSDGFWVPLGNDALAKGFFDADVMTVTPTLMDRAEELAGPTGDNLSVIALSWEEGFDEASTTRGSVETETMPQNAHTTRMEGMDKNRAREPELTDDDLERAIEEIRNAIQKYSK
jgi:serine/threonine protein phosphatase PrpC